MRYSEIKFSKKVSAETKPSLGQYENEEFSLTAILTEDDKIDECAVEVVKSVMKYLGVETLDIDTNAKLELNERPTKEVEEPKKEVKEPKKVAKKAAKKKVKKKVKAVSYDRTDDGHKKRLGELCADLFGEEWRSNKEVLPKVKQASMALVGENFIGEEGVVLDTFVKKFQEMVR